MLTKIGFVTFGCALNQSDSEVMKGILKEAGHEITEPKDSEIVIINSCTVKNLAEKKLFRSIVKYKDKKVIIAGCVPQADRILVEKELKNYSIIGTTQLKKIDYVVEETLNGNIVQLLKIEKDERLNLPKIRKNKIIEIVPICSGCLDHCTYCKTKHARGNLLSYSPRAIIQQVQTAVDEGCKEIWLTSQDCGAYGKDLDTNIVELLQKIIKIEGNFKVRLGMANPTYFPEFLDDLIEVMKHPKIFKFLHIPVQAGNNQVLNDMKRRYTIEDYKSIVKKIKDEIPEMTISTDIICGFPTETEEQFEDTINLIKETRPEMLNISRFWLRPGTPAANLKQIPTRFSKERSIILKTLHDQMMIENNKSWIGWKGEVLIDEPGKETEEGKTWIARNYAYKQIVLKDAPNLSMGISTSVEAVKAEKYHIEGVQIKS